MNLSKYAFLISCCVGVAHPLWAMDQRSTTAASTTQPNDRRAHALSARIAHISEQFLGKPYLLGALGEGPTGTFDQAPLFRTDAFDCETFVDTVLALALTNNPEKEPQLINQIRYQNAHISFLFRNHFTCLDWNKNNQRQGFLKDITPTFQDTSHHPVAQLATAVIDKPSWYQHLPLSTIRVTKLNENERAVRLQTLKQAGAALAVCTSDISYLPLTALMNKQGEANQALFNQIPQGAIIEIIRPNWDLQDAIGTHLNVSHMGFAIWKNHTLFFREASSIAHQVVDIPLINYLQDARKSPTIKGINIQIAEPVKSYNKYQ